MAGKNQTTVNPGNTVSLDMYLRPYYEGPLTNADTIPTFTIYDPDDVELYTGTSIHTDTGIYTATYDVESTAEISDYYKIVWNITLHSIVVDNAEEYFRVVPATSEYTNITINSGWLNQVKKVTAYPKLANFSLTDDEIKEYAVFPAMTRYFIKFPLKSKVEYAANSDSSLTVEFPDDYTFGLLDCRVVNSGMIGGTGNSFWDIVAFQQYGVAGNATIYNKRGYNPNQLYQQRYDARYALKSQINALATNKFNINVEDRKVIIYTSTTGMINLTWAKYSNSFEDIRYQRKFDVIQLAQAELLDHMADIFGLITDGTLDVDINVADIRTRAKELREEILEKWNNFPNMILLKGV
jgi:hypothetical protein